MVIHFIIDTEPHLTSKQLKQRISAAAKAQCQKQIRGALSLEIRLFYNMPLYIAGCQHKRTYAEKGMIRPIEVNICRPSLEDIQVALHSIVYEEPTQIVDLRVYQFYSVRPRIEIILNRVDDLIRS
ncbi:RusA family crossover junction endodeoxyribonuclease [Bacillus sp. NPDC093026]|uniref:RusA family crossover junction endodeoxyribonuclease n=1 Tax=Bacillus sp. NPDC093026 TaxID=3363948 RepID=UPI00382EE203